MTVGSQTPWCLACGMPRAGDGPCARCGAPSPDVAEATAPAPPPRTSPPPPTGPPLSTTPPPGVTPPPSGPVDPWQEVTLRGPLPVTRAGSVPPTLASSAVTPPAAPAAPPVPPAAPPPRRRPTALIVGLLVAAAVFLGGGVTTGILLAKDDSRRPDPAQVEAQKEIDGEIDGAAGAPTDGATVPEPAPTDAPPPAAPQAVPAQPIRIDDNQGETQKDNAGPRVTSAADVRQVRVVPAVGDGPAWVFVEFWGRPAPPVGVIVRFDTDGDNKPEFVSWRHLTNGTSGSGPVGGWGHGRETLRGSRQADPRFQAGGHVPPESGQAFPFRLAPGDIPAGAVRVNVQVISDDGYYDYAPHRKVWSDATGVGPAS